MSLWKLFVCAVEFGVTAVILVLLIWAAGDRARVHQPWRGHWGVALGLVTGCA